jgi:hypothetical protein
VRAKLSRGRSARPGANDDESILSLYASRPLAVAEEERNTPFLASTPETANDAQKNDATLWICARDTKDAPPPRYASTSAALFVLRLAPAFGGVSSAPAGAIPSAEEARLRAFASSLVGAARLDSKTKTIPLLVLVEENSARSAAARRATAAAVESAVASAVASAAARTGTGRSTSPVAVRVDAIGGGDAADDLRGVHEPARTLWARRNDALAKGVRWMASVAPPEPYFLDAYLRDEVRDALANGGTLDAATTTPAACVGAWNDAVESVRARLASAGASVAPSGFAAEFADADTPGAFLRRRGGALAKNDAASEHILASARLPPFPDAPSERFPTLESLVGSYLSALDPSGPLPPGAVAACLAKAGARGCEEADPRRPHRVWPAVFREIFARRLADIEAAQTSSGAGPACVSAATDETTPTKAPLSDLPTQAPEPDRATRWLAKIRKTPAEVSDEIEIASSRKRRRVDSDEPVAPLSLETELPRLVRAKAEVENFEAWLLQAASPAPHAGGDPLDAEAKLRKLAGLGDLKTISF